MKGVDKYSMMIVLKYFQTKDDFIHSMLICKKYADLNEMFHYNPIPIFDGPTSRLFPNIETQYIYSLKDTLIPTVNKYEVWCVTDYNNQIITNKDIKYHHLAIKGFKQFVISETNPIPENVTDLISFSVDKNLKRLEIPDSVTKISSNLFYCSKQLTYLKLPSNLKVLKVDDRKTNIKDIDFGNRKVIPFEVTSEMALIAKNKGIECQKVVYYERKNENNDILIEIGNIWGHLEYKGNEIIGLPSHYKSIKSVGYSTGSKIKEIYIGDNKITRLECYVLYPYNLDWNKIGIETPNVHFSRGSDEIVGGVNALVPLGVVQIGSYSFDEHVILDELTIPTSVTKLRSRVFEGNGTIKKVYLPLGLKKIGENCFSYSEINSIVIPTTVTLIGDSPFLDCPLTTLTIPNSVVCFGDNILSCKKDTLQYLTIPYYIYDKNVISEFTNLKQLKINFN